MSGTRTTAGLIYIILAWLLSPEYVSHVKLLDVGPRSIPDRSAFAQEDKDDVGAYHRRRP
jgi:hypothetical protein